MPQPSELRLAIAGAVVVIALPHAGWLPLLLPRLGKFRSDLPPQLRLEVVLDSDLDHAPGGDPIVSEDEHGLHLRHDYFAGWVPPTGPARLTIVQASSDPVDGLYVMVVDSLLRLCMAQWLAGRGGVMFHAAGVATAPDAGYVFFGPSGSGKTTVCQLSFPRYRILCDEIIAVAPEPSGTGYRLYGTPFNGAWGDSLPEDVPLRELFYLRQAPHTRRVTLAPGRALAVLMESVVAYHQSPGFLTRLMDALVTLLERVPVTQLEFEPKESLWTTVLPATPTH